MLETTNFFPLITFQILSMPNLEAIWPLNLLFDLENKKNLAFTSMKFLLLTGHLLSSGDFSFTFWFCTWKFWKATFESLGAQRWNPLYKKMETCFYICVIVLNCIINLVSRQFVHNFKICQYVNLSSLNQYCVQPSVNRSAKLSLKNMSKGNDLIV